MGNDNLIEVLQSKESIFNGHVVHLQKWCVTLPNGKPAVREVAVHRGASAIVPVDAEGNVYMVKQYRTPIQRILLEIPAGKLDYVGEDRLEAARRELREETGFTAEKWTHLVDLDTTPGFCSEVISVYLAENLTRGKDDPDDDEFLDVIKMPFEKAVAMAMTGELTDSKTITGLLLANGKLRREE